jgi:O-acetyl-ADP-ribose deacetylase (regulator of RNase III)
VIAPAGFGFGATDHFVPFQRVIKRVVTFGASATPTATQLLGDAHETDASHPYCAPATGGTTDHAGAALAGGATAMRDAQAKPNEIPPATILPKTPRIDPRVTSHSMIEPARSDITIERVDAIVNAANGALRRGGGVCGAIFAAAGPGLDAACAAIGSCETGDAVITPGFRLTARWIVHTVGPVWHGGDRGEAVQLASCYRRSIEVAGAAGASSIAFPAISTGIFGYPPRAAAEIAVTTVRAHAGEMELIRLVAFDESTYADYRSLLT